MKSPETPEEERQRTLSNLRFHSVSMNEPENPRELYGRASRMLEQLIALSTPIKCSNCTKEVARAHEWYRCFDCKCHLCEHCVVDHFSGNKGGTYTPHHQKMETYMHQIEILKLRLAKYEPPTF